MYHYKISSTHDSSAKYGNCEVCNQTASEVFMQIETKDYSRHDGFTGTTHKGCFDKFGHKDCLENIRR